MHPMSQKALEWLEKKNPLLALQSIRGTKTVPLEKGSFVIEDVEVIFIRGIKDCFKEIIPFLEKGGHVIFIEDQIDSIHTFLAHPRFSFEEKIDIMLPNEETYCTLAKKYFFSKKQFVGELQELKSWMDEAHLIASDYRDFGKEVVKNIICNLMHTSEVVDGRDLKGVYQGSPIIVCGAGPSLERGLDQIRKHSKHAVVIAAGSAIPKLIKAKIPIDYGVIIDPNPPLIEYEEAKELTFPLFFQYRASHSLFALHKGPKIWMGEGGMWPFERWVLDNTGLDSYFFETGWNVGNFAFHLALFLGGDPIVTFGLDGGEYIEGNFVTRRDLSEGVKWLGKKKEEYKEKTFLTIDQEFSFTGEIDKTVPLQGRRFDLTCLQQIQIEGHRKKIESFLDSLQKPQVLSNVLREKLVIEVDLLQDPIYEYLLLPLWEQFKPLFPYADDKEKIIAEMTFYLTVLKMQEIGELTLYFYENGQLYAIERRVDGKKEGVFTSYFEEGKLKSRIEYKGDFLEGDFTLYSQNGLRRKGKYVKGKKVGEHLIFNDQGVLIVRASFDHDLPVGTHYRYNDEGTLMEELIYHNPKQFDRRTYTDEGDLKQEGVFTKDDYLERKFVFGRCIESRKGKWENGALVWL